MNKRENNKNTRENVINSTNSNKLVQEEEQRTNRRIGSSLHTTIFFFLVRMLISLPVKPIAGKNISSNNNSLICVETHTHTVCMYKSGICYTKRKISLHFISDFVRLLKTKYFFVFFKFYLM